MSTESQERALLESILPDLEAEGFEVYVQPSPHSLPSFIRNYRPDVIARRSDKNLIIEIVREGRPTDKRSDALREVLSTHKDWELKTYYVSPNTTVQQIEPAS